MKSNTNDLGKYVLYFVLIVSSIVDIPRTINLGTVSLSALLTIFNTILVWFFLLLVPVTSKSVFKLIFPFLLFVTWALLSFFWYPPTINSFQNVLVYIEFIGLILLSSRLVNLYKNFSVSLERLIIISTSFAAVLYGIGLLVDGLGSKSIITPRAWALYGLTGSSLLISRWRSGSSKQSLLFATFIIALIGMSLSRMGFIVSILIIPLAFVQTDNLKSILSALMVALVTAVIIFVIVFYVEPIRSRFFTGDLAISVGGVSINAMGRTRIWEIVYDSFLESPFVGQGAGSANDLVNRYFFNVGHPHNDYLRILHDYGLIGFSLFFIGYVSLIFKTYGDWIKSIKLKGDKYYLSLAAFLSLVGFSIVMLTDNAIVYHFVIAPLGILIGSSLGQARSIRATLKNTGQKSTKIAYSVRRKMDSKSGIMDR